MNKEIYTNYAKLVIKYGINLQKGQDVIVYSSTRAIEFARYIVEEAYHAGAARVRVDINDEKIDYLTYKYEDEKVLDTVLEYEEAKSKYRAEKLPCLVYISDEDPDAFNGLDVNKITNVRAARYKVIKKYRDLEDNNNQWVIISVPSPSWAKKMFPNDSEEVAMQKLWEAIIHTTRLEGDAIANWDQHVNYLAEKAAKLNALNLDYLKYSSSNGTDLTLKLQPNHEWISAREVNLKGIGFIANMPTEEVFTMPKRDGVDGVVYSTKPLSLNGQLVEDFKVTFEKGKCVDVDARVGKDTLVSMLDMDESSRHLGEVALVPYNSPINETGLLFYNTLFDENACCHLAFGQAFKNNIRGYEKMSEEDFQKAGFNDSVNHVDFMIGSKDLSIVGYDHEGQAHQIFKDGVWAL